MARCGEWDLAAAWHASRDVLPEWLLPVAEYSFGNYVGLSLRPSDLGSVWFWDEAAPGGVITKVAGNLPEFLDRLREPATEEPEVISVWVASEFTPEFDD